MPPRKRSERKFILSLDDKKQILPNGNTIDWKKGMMNQLSLVGTDYLEWIDHPKLVRCRLFDSDFLEGFTFTNWWVVPTLFIPWGLLEARELLVRPESPLFGQYNLEGASATIFLIMIGMLLWTLTEYVYHRFAFHWQPQSNWQNYVHFLGHGLHHLTPADEYRLVFPPVVSVPLGFLHRNYLFYALFPYGISSALYGGYIIGYALYESSHYFCHHYHVGKWLTERYLWHAKHHFDQKYHDKIYGVSSQLWDHVFGTF